MHYEAAGDESSILYFYLFSPALNVLKYLLSNTINVVRKILNNEIIKQTTYVIEGLLLWVSGA